MNCVQDSCVVCQILHVSFIFATARRHMPQTWRDTSRYERLVFVFIFYGLASRALRCAVFIECYETPTTWDSLLSSAILFTQDRRGGCLHMYALRTHTAPFKVLHLSCFVSSYTRCPSVPYWTRLILLVCRMLGSTQLRVHLSRCLCSLALYSLETLFCVNCGG